MSIRFSRSCLLWLLLGLVTGGGIAWTLPHRAIHAYSSDRNDKFTMTTAVTGPTTEAVFVLDFLTGQLRGFALDRSAQQFMVVYNRSVAADFRVDANKTTRYALVSGMAQRTTRGNQSWAPSYLYVAELSTGRVQCYAIPYRDTRTPTTIQLIPVPNLNFVFAEPRETE